MFKKCFLFFVFCCTAFPAAAAQIAILFNGNTPVNSETIHFLEKQMQQTGQDLKLVPVSDGSTIKPGLYKAILILNTGIPAGIDRKLAEFINAWAQKSDLLLISLRTGSKDVKVESLTASPATLGIDGIAAASTWKGKGLSALFGGKNSPEYEMHLEWTKRVIHWIQTRP
ncbi:MAG TPA: hypothetical protein VLM37_06010 [Fibrobacteraceae bacterium]|nr:hypothetical protein [Fibrobacteraceae bacterium]